MNIVQEVYDWNKERGLLEDRIDVSLEYSMIKEELLELLIADNRVDVADALADIIFVALGSLSKLTKDEQKVHDIMMVVCAANNLKGRDTVGGKITKPEGFSGPEGMIKEILDA